MTRDDVLALSAGRELDRLVAQRVMGHVWRRYNSPVGPVRYLAAPDDRDNWSDADGSEPEGDDPWRYPPCYSTSIAAAWEVFRHCCGWRFSKRSFFLTLLEDQSRLPDGALPRGLFVLAALRDRFPEAVCKAALLAVLDTSH